MIVGALSVRFSNTARYWPMELHSSRNGDTPGHILQQKPPEMTASPDVIRYQYSERQNYVKWEYFLKRSSVLNVKPWTMPMRLLHKLINFDSLLLRRLKSISKMTGNCSVPQRQAQIKIEVDRISVV